MTFHNWPRSSPLKNQPQTRIRPSQESALRKKKRYTRNRVAGFKQSGWRQGARAPWGHVTRTCVRMRAPLNRVIRFGWGGGAEPPPHPNHLSWLPSLPFVGFRACLPTHPTNMSTGSRRNSGQMGGPDLLPPSSRSLPTLTSWRSNRTPPCHQWTPLWHCFVDLSQHAFDALEENRGNRPRHQTSEDVADNDPENCDLASRNPCRTSPGIHPVAKMNATLDNNSRWRRDDLLSHQNALLQLDFIAQLLSGCRQSLLCVCLCTHNGQHPWYNRNSINCLPCSW